MHFCGDFIAIGQPFVLIEPKFDASTIQKDMPALQISNPFIPLWGCHFVQSTRNRTMTSLRDE
jgi:hypothetical protein